MEVKSGYRDWSSYNGSDDLDDGILRLLIFMAFGIGRPGRGANACAQI